MDPACAEVVEDRGVRTSDRGDNACLGLICLKDCCCEGTFVLCKGNAVYVLVIENFIRACVEYDEFCVRIVC